MNCGGTLKRVNIYCQKDISEISHKIISINRRLMININDVTLNLFWTNGISPECIDFLRMAYVI